MKILVIGGTRNIGYFLVRRLYDQGHHLTLLNRGITRDDLPEDIARLRCDRTDIQQMRRALGDRRFDIAIDMTLYKGEEAEAVVDILGGQVGHYIFISTGQVYLVREGIPRPFKEADYAGPVMDSPEPNTYDYEEWLYGMEKRRAEDVLAAAHVKDGFPYTTLRLPMVNGERDPFNRLYGYLLRIRDGGPILVPQAQEHRLRHVYAGDVITAIAMLIDQDAQGRAYNLAQNETVSLEAFLNLLGELVGKPPRIERVERRVLESQGFLPDCSPFSDLWMSELDNTRSKDELGLSYTPLRDYLANIVAYHADHPTPTPAGYRRRNAEKALLASPL